jgi:hypothetical protein
MKINVYEYPSCTWELEDGSFYCTHDEIEVVDYVTDHMGFNGHYQIEQSGYACAECGESLEGSPAEDLLDTDWEYERSRED